MKMKNILRTMPAKIIIYLATCVSMIIGLVSAGGFMGCYKLELYENTPEELLIRDAKREAHDSARTVLSNILPKLNDEGELESEESLSLEDIGYDEYQWREWIATNFMYSVIDTKDKCVIESEGFDKSKVKYTYYLTGLQHDNGNFISEKKEKTDKKYVTLYCYYDGNNERPDIKNFNETAALYKLLYKYKDDVLPLGIVSVILAFVFYITMMCVSGRRPDSQDVHPGYFNKVPFDVMFVAALFVGCMFILFAEGGWPDEMIFAIICAAIVCAIFIFNGLSMSVAARIKEGTLIKNTLIFIVCGWCLKLCLKIFKKYVLGLIKWIFNKFAGLYHFFGEVFRKFPLIWKTVAVFCGISLFEFIVFMISWYEPDNYLVFWLILHIILFVVVCRFSLGLRGLQESGRALATGDFDYKVDTSKLRGDFKEHGENLNHVSDGMITAVAEKMKSERMKTELITNVSHDIKTPLTSIINYADLIGKERTDNDKIKEYTEVLLRQSERLKRLIEDLVEASKASTGNLEVELAPCEASMFITQIAGEYEEKLEKSGLTLVTKINCDSIKIMADGRRMLRVFDNLMNNICKYALENSRVYLSLDAQENNLVMITFKNTSKAELDMSPEELMERFVRGDQSRNTEGNGLGLSIARSLTELQGGTFDISIDGDLFKVILTFPAK